MQEQIITKQSLQNIRFLPGRKEIFNELAIATGLDCVKSEKLYWWCRHPLAVLVEARRRYLPQGVMDIEDVFRLSSI
ncbi:MAG: hypothetical protein U5J96_04395 [Ignavibacteriaceae bacterium]|nr:hypothetical protein [Ignavibacteriaceae bacterium]